VDSEKFYYEFPPDGYNSDGEELFDIPGINSELLPPSDAAMLEGISSDVVLGEAERLLGQWTMTMEIIRDSFRSIDRREEAARAAEVSEDERRAIMARLGEEKNEKMWKKQKLERLRGTFVRTLNEDYRSDSTSADGVGVALDES
jgi:hypothetical protein